MKDLTPRCEDLDPIEIASRDEIAALQLKRMKWSLKHAYDNVPFYRKSFDDAGVHPDDLTSLSDLAKFPFTVKQDLRDNYPFGLFAVPREQISRIHASSGTTGQPTVVGYTKNDLTMWGDVVGRSLRASGLRPGDVLHNAYGFGLFTGGMTQRQVRQIEDFQADGITVTPSYALSILDEYARESPLKVDIYGLSEVIGPGVANECEETKDGLHIWEDHFYPETINPTTVEVVEVDEMGELVFTPLTKEGFPIIRYRTRDLTRLLPGTARSMRRMEKITGRSDDMIILRGVNIFPTQIEEQLMEVPQLSPHFQIELHRPGRMDEMMVHVELAEGVSVDIHTEAAHKLKGLVKSHVGVTVKVNVTETGGVERSQGKAVRIVDNRPKE